MESAKERLVRYLQYKGIGQNSFERKAGISNGYISNLRHTPKAKLLEKILAAAPDLSRVWLMTGEGSMIAGPLENRVHEVSYGDNSVVNNAPFAVCCGGDGDHCTIVSRYNEELARLREENERLRKECADKDAERGKLLAMLEKFILGN